MSAWSIAPWLIALAIAAGLGVLGRCSDIRSRRRQDADADRETADRSYGYSDDD